MLIKEMDGNILVLRLDIPAKLNAWSQAIRDDVGATLRKVAADDTVGAVVLTGTGPKAFCAGADLTDPTMGDPAAAAGRMVAFRELYMSVLSFPKPLVSALNGLALGSAFQVVLLTDTRIGHDKVEFGLPEINSGMPCITGSTILSWAVGPILTRSLIVSGRHISAQEAFRHGILDELVPQERVIERALETARSLAAKAPHAFAASKLWIRDMLVPELDAAFERAARVRGDKDVAGDVRGGIGQFFQARALRRQEARS